MNIRQCHCCHEFSGPAPDPDSPDDEWICAACEVTPKDKHDRQTQGMIRILKLFKVEYDIKLEERVLDWVANDPPQSKLEIQVRCSNEGRDFFHHLLAAEAMGLITGISSLMSWKWTGQMEKVVAKWR